MSESPPPAVVGDAAGNNRPQVLTPESIATILTDFRFWLQQLAEAGPQIEAGQGPEPEPPIDLHTLLGQFVALRHEVNLQTKATRSQQEQNAEALQQLSAALEALQQAQATDEQVAEQAKDEHLRPLLKTLVDLYDALAIAGREMQRVQQSILPTLDQMLAPAPAPPAPIAAATEENSFSHPAPSFWARLFRFGQAGTEPNAAQPQLPAPAPPPQGPTQAKQAVERVRQVFDSLVTGYTMSLQRVERALHQHGLEPIPCVNQPFDPEWMEVVDVVTDAGRSANEVIEEVRRGYLWNGRVFRYAQVRVAKAATALP